MEPAVRILPASLELMEALATDRARFEQLIGSPIPEGWPEFPEAARATLAALRAGANADWGMHFFLADGALVGSGGYHSAPADGAVEIGYEVAPAHRGRGYGTAAARALVDRAIEAGVEHVLAHTLAAPSPSTGVLAALDFVRVGATVDSPDGPIWEWRLESPLTSGSADGTR